jgi:hypothetical protein
MSPRQRVRSERVVRQPFEEIFEARRIERELRRKLPKDRTAFCAQLEQTVGEEVRERRIENMRDAYCNSSRCDRSGG